MGVPLTWCVSKNVVVEIVETADEMLESHGPTARFGDVPFLGGRTGATVLADVVNQPLGVFREGEGGGIHGGEWVDGEEGRTGDAIGFKSAWIL